MPISLEPLLAHLPAWLLVLFRMTGLFVLGPVFGSRLVLARVKVFLALGLSFCIYPMLLSPGSVTAANVAPILDGGLHLARIVPAIAMELLIGMVIGFGVGLPLVGMQMGSHVIDQQMGLGIAGVYNPEFDEQVGVISEFYYLLAVTVFVLMGGHRAVLGTLVGSFGKVPLGGYVPDGHLLELVIGLLTVTFELGLRVSGPLLCLFFLETVAMGFIARTVPQMNVLSIGFPLRILVGLVLLIASVGVMTSAYQETLIKTLERLRLFWTT
jgi:flagellar biosynthetic protein FliR